MSTKHSTSDKSDHDHKKSNTSYEKVFQVRNSPLTDRFENNVDIRTIYNLFAIILISLLTNTIIYDYSKTGKVHFGGLRLIILGFNKFDLVILIWFTLNVFALLGYYSFRFWALTRTSLKPKTCKFWDKLWISILVFCYGLALYTMQKITAFFGFAPASSTVLFLEHIRILMKLYAFIRTNSGRVVDYKIHSEKSLVLPNLKQFVYFFFAPTMIYRDEYPRTKFIRWKFVIHNFLEVLGIIFLLSLVVERFLVPPFEDFCLRQYSLSEVLIPVLGNTFPGVLFMLGGFYSVLHSFQNAFAEMLKFGDRMFYREWWTSRSLSEYFRTWNVLVHDWLFTYIYKDVYDYVVPRSKTASKLAVFAISAIVHEWIICNVLGLFIPIQFSQFFLTGAVLALLNVLDLPVGNLVVWYLIVIGSGMQVNVYTLEFFARRNCPSENYINGTDFYKLRFITCDCINI